MANPGYVDPVTHARNPQTLMSNSFVVQDTSVVPNTFSTRWRSGCLGCEFFQVTDPSTQRLWPMNPVRKDANTLTVPLSRVSTATGQVNAVYYSNVDLTGGTYTPSAPQPLSSAFTPVTGFCGSTPTTVVYGEGSLVNPDGSGRTYLWGTENCGGFLYVHLASVVGTDLTQPWSYWTGAAHNDVANDPANWSTNPNSAVRLNEQAAGAFGDAGHELSVVKTATGYRMLYSALAISNDIRVRTSTFPWGAFSAPTTIYLAPEAGMLTYGNQAANGGAGDPNCVLVTYNAKEHPELEAPGQIVFTYNVNVANRSSTQTCANPFFHWANDVDNYRPRFMVVST